MNKSVLLVLAVFVIQSVSAAHFIVGQARDSYDGILADGKEVVLWNPARGVDDNLTDIIGPSGNSGTSNVYMIDCELLKKKCKVGDEIRVRLLYDGQEVNLTVTKAGYDIAPNITLNSKPNITFIVVDDSIASPSGQIDLIAAFTRIVTCEAVVEEYDGNPLQNILSEFYLSSQGDSDDNNYHYTNSTCFVNASYGNENQSKIDCDFEVWYYANPGMWTCFLNIEDNLSFSGNSTNTTTVNTLLSVGVQDIIDFSHVDTKKVSDEIEVNVTNYGNIRTNLSLAGYANAQGDGLAMNCTFGSISIEHQKYNLTSSNPGALDLGDADSIYVNMSSQTAIKKFDLDYKTQEEVDAANSTYWRIYVPLEVAGNCQGNIVFGASQDSGD